MTYNIVFRRSDQSPALRAGGGGGGGEKATLNPKP